MNISKTDLKIERICGGGKKAGGQHLNKTASCIRITHIPTGIVVSQMVEISITICVWH